MNTLAVYINNYIIESPGLLLMNRPSARVLRGVAKRNAIVGLFDFDHYILLTLDNTLSLSVLSVPCGWQ